jgi:hypothetical protein
MLFVVLDDTRTVGAGMVVVSCSDCMVKVVYSLCSVYVMNRICIV